MVKVVFKWIVNVILVIAIALLCGYFFLRIYDKIEIYNVKTGSMEDKIHAGDYILIFRKNDYHVGDVVTFIRNDGFITHRIVKIENGRVTTKGDANNTIDEDIPISNILGKVILVGGILNFVITYKYMIACVLLSLYLFSCYFDKKQDIGGEENKETSEIEVKEEKTDEEVKDDAEETKVESVEEKKNENEVGEENKETPVEEKEELEKTEVKENEEPKVEEKSEEEVIIKKKPREKK